MMDTIVKLIKNTSAGVDPSTADSSHRMSALITSEASVRCVQSRHAHTRALRLETGYYDNSPVTVLLLKPITGKKEISPVFLEV
ncbi:hypothetical protein HF086_008517 [Spodoptera exigua]|uniref:Uncharacterized protein n=1 Tax=Spodoptera exigua TaxID=7107 RepID=A0A922MRK4_SPOEX|nr:hypothetical protein HF086_008517 [Spodoptera exigua]